ncbi:TonB-dependent receptor [Brevundimonas sp. A19_0]|uniref:TonB-dependent receptor plug domain-containing protein n=1 Tax=Brevundimonas sp. A19_0 TaxID=2821087 RepID=UPI001ADB4615|nr:TonB-dependent receptor [Brevundimonas sp. A19_0]MBO9501281.1 TonB-dependent receptor [Brevundimonas sp. A19_0]
MKRQSILTLPTLAMGASALVIGLCLAGKADAREDPETRLEDLLVHATRLHQIQSQTPGSRVFTAADIEARGARFAVDLLDEVPGAAIARTGAFGGVSQLRLRGAGPGKTLVLIDGVPVNDPADINGAYDFANLSLIDMERVEVLSGPQSSLWGSDAIGGVIAFTTREVDGLRAELEAGSLNTQRGALSVGRSGDRSALSLSVSGFRTDGVSAAAIGTEDDGYETLTTGLRGRLSPVDGVGLDGALRWTKSRVEIDGFPAPAFALADTDDVSKGESWSGFGRMTVQTGGVRHRLSLSASDLERETRSDYASRFQGDRQVWRWDLDGTGGEGRLNWAAGLERRTEAADLDSGLSDELGTTSAFGTVQFPVGPRVTLSAALRHDDTDDFGSATTGRVTAHADLGAGFGLSGAWGTGFRAPSVSQSVCDFCFSSAPLPALVPEEGEGHEVALGWTSADRRLEGRVTLYRLTVENQIVYRFDPVTFDSVYINLDETETDGVEVEGRALLGAGFDLSLSYGWTDARDATTDLPLLRVPEHKGSLGLGYVGDRLSTRLTVRAESDQPDSGGTRDGFVTADLFGSWALTPDIELTGRIDNLADERFQRVLGYGEPGRTVAVGVRLRY